MLHLGIIFLISYLVGSINFGLILGYIQGLDLRNLGSGNAGATNALRILGARSGLFVFFGDAFKGYFALYLCDRIVAKIETLLFNDTSNILTRDKSGNELHVNRKMNVWGSGGAHKLYFKKIDEIILEIFNRPIECVVWMICLYKFEFSTTSKSTIPIRPIPAAAR